MASKKNSVTVRVSLDMSQEANELLENLASARGATKSQILRMAVALFHVAADARSQGQRIGVFDQDQKLIREIVGL